MRRLLLGTTLVAALTLAIAAIASPDASSGATSAQVAAGEATPTPYWTSVATPTPLPGTAAVGSARIIVHNVLNGVPFVYGSGSIPHYALVDGQLCGRVVLDRVYPASLSYLVPWPWGTHSVCDETGVTVHVCMRPVAPMICADGFRFGGEDVTVDIEWSRYPDLLLDRPTIKAHFNHEGVEQPVTLKRWDLTGEGSNDNVSDLYDVPVTLTTVVRFGPYSETFRGTTLDAVFDTVEFGELHASLFWSGDEDVTLEVDTGRLLATPTPTPTPATSATPAPTPTPATLPQTGGRP